MKSIDQFAVRRGRLLVGGIDAEELATRAGTPCYVYDAAIFRRQYRTLAGALPPGTAIHFSLKANPNVAVASIFARLGAGAEVASGAELETALASGFRPKKILFAGPVKSDTELARGVEAGIGCVNVESGGELARLAAIAARAGKVAPVALRINLDATLPTRTGRVMVGGAQKFGFDDDAVDDTLRRLLAEPSLRFAGFHCFSGTQLTDHRTLTAAYRAFAQWVRRTTRRLGLPAVPTLNFGGGLGIPFADGAPELDVARLGKTLASLRTSLAADPRFAKTRFIVEPGRYLAGPAGVYLTRVVDLKVSRGTRFVLTDGGIHHALVPIVMNKAYPTRIVTRIDRPRRTRCVVAGPLCSSADRFSREVALPSPQIGDLLGIFNSGAYGYSAGMHAFLSHPAPPEILADRGRAWIIRQRHIPHMGLPHPPPLTAG